MAEDVSGRCPACGAPQAADTSFCVNCGASVAAHFTCQSCGANLAAGAGFCETCGAAVAPAPPLGVPPPAGYAPAPPARRSAVWVVVPLAALALLGVCVAGVGLTWGRGRLLSLFGQGPVVQPPPPPPVVSTADGARVEVPAVAPTSTPTDAATPTVAPTATAGHGLQPLPRRGVAIRPDNAAQVGALALWGKGAVYDVAYSPDGGLLAVGTALGVYLYDSRSLDQVLHIGQAFTARDVVFSPDGATLAAGSWDGTVRLWRASDGALLRSLEGHGISVGSVAFSPDGATLASASDTVRLWRASDGALLRSLEGHVDTVYSVAFSPDGATLASASDTVRLWGVQ